MMDPLLLNRAIVFEMSKRATELRKSGELEKALPFYRELAKDDSDPYSAAGLLHCFRKLHLFNEALPLCTPTNQKHMVIDWYRTEVIWTLIQGRLSTLDNTASVQDVVSVAKSIRALEPKDYGAKWRTVHPVLKTARAHKKWDIVFEWTEKVTPDELSTTPMKDDRDREGWCEQALWYNYRIRSMIEVGGE